MKTKVSKAYCVLKEQVLGYRLEVYIEDLSEKR